jgi:DNA-binding beta-propeller fold protein YncE
LGAYIRSRRVRGGKMKKKKLIVIAAAVAGGVFFLAALHFLGPTPEAKAAGTILDSFQIDSYEEYLLTGLTKIGNNFWVTDGWWYEYETEGEVNHVYEVTRVVGAPGSIVSSFPSPQGYNNLKGIAHRVMAPYGNCLWLCAGENPPSILTVTTTGSIVSASSFTIDYQAGGLAWDGTYLYSVDYQNGKIYKYNSAGSIITPFPVDAPDKNSKDRVPFGIAYDGQYLWVTCYGKYDRIVKMTTTGSITGTAITVPNTPHPFPTAITAEGAYLWYADDATDTFYKIDK